MGIPNFDYIRLNIWLDDIQMNFFTHITKFALFSVFAS